MTSLPADLVNLAKEGHCLFPVEPRGKNVSPFDCAASLHFENRTTRSKMNVAAK
jgi:hypothetical protein